MEPALALLNLSKRSRIFQEMSVPDILQAVLDEGLSVYQREIEMAVEETYPTREYCLQYRESDLAFAERLMQEEGIAYAITHDGDTEQVVLTDRNGSFEEIDTGDVVFYERVDDVVSDALGVHEVRRVATPTTTKVMVRDHDWMTPAEPKSAESGDGDRESYQFGLGRHLTLTDYDGDRQAPLRLEGLMRDAVLLRGAGRVIGFAPGLKFQLVGHSGALDGEYLLLEVHHHSAIGEGADDPYENHFTAIPYETPYRPSRVRPKPRIPSVQTAVVVGPSGEEIHTDEHGRVKVQFPWDLEGANDENSSCWLRVQQAWAHGSWGHVFIPRIGMEVAVHFAHGDPDRPVVHGCLYNSEHHPPYGLPDEKTKSTIKSESSPGGGGFNELRFEDKMGSEQVYLHAQKDLDELVKNDHTTSVGGDQTNTVGNDQTQDITGFQEETVHCDQTMTVDGNRTVEVTGKFTEIILGGEERKIKGDELEIITGGETRLVVGGMKEEYGDTETRAVIGGQTEAIIGGHTQTIGAGHSEVITGSLTQVAAGGYTLESSGGTLTAIAGAPITTIGLGGGTLTATSVTILAATHTMIDPHQQSVDWTSSGTTGASSSQTGLAITIGGLSASATGASAAATLVAIAIATTGKISATGISLDLGSFKSWGSNAAAQTFAFKIKVY